MDVPVSQASPPIPVVFPPVVHGAKMVLGRGGSDYGGDLEGRGTILTERMHELGLSLTRVGIGWGGVEPVRGAPYEFAEEDELVGFLLDHGIEPLIVLACAPRWAYDEQPGDYEFFRDALKMENLYSVVTPSEKFADEYAAAIETTARRYRGRIRYYEFWNEPDGMAGPVLLRDAEGKLVSVRFGGDAVRYTWWLKKTYEALKRGDPDALLAAGSLCEPSPDFLEAIYHAGGRGFFDAVSIHPYAPNGINTEFLDALRDVMVRQGDAHLGLWITEYSWKTTGVTDEFMRAYRVATEADKAEMLDDAVLQVARRPFVTMSILHSLDDWRSNDADPSTTESFGLVTYSGKPKKTFEAFARAMERDRERRERAAAIAGPSVLHPGFPAAFVLQGELARCLRPTFRLPEGWTAQRRDATGENPVFQVTPAADAETGKTYAVGIEDPAGDAVALRYVELQDPVQIRGAVDERAMVNFEGARPLGITFQNISPFALRATLRGTMPGGWRLDKPAPVMLRPGAEATTALSVHAPEDAGPGWHVAQVQAVAEARAGTPLELRFGIAPPCPRIESRDDLPAPTIRAGTDERGFAARIGWSDEFLFLEVDVRDASHHQSVEKGFDLWREDSLQIGFDPLFDAVKGARYQADDYEYVFALGERAGVRSLRYAGPASVGDAPEVRTEIQRDERANRTLYRIAFPWESLRPLEPGVGRTFGLSILQNDFDGRERHTVEWGGGIADVKAPWFFVGVQMQP